MVRAVLANLGRRAAANAVKLGGAMALILKRVGRYELLKEIGRGGMSFTRLRVLNVTSFAG